MTPGDEVRLSICPGCGVELAVSEGLTHRYLESSPACWETFGRIIGKEFGDPSYWPLHTLTVDTFAAQHPGTRSDQTRHSAAFHLVGLCLVMERGMDPTASGRFRQKGGTTHKDLPWLEPPEYLGAMTTADVAPASTPGEHARLVRAWGRAVWDAWHEYHPTVRAWTDRLGSVERARG